MTAPTNVHVEVLYQPRGVFGMDYHEDVNDMEFIRHTDTGIEKLAREDVAYELVHEQYTHAYGDNPKRACETLWMLFNGAVSQQKGIRSMMVGDIIKLDGETYVCRAFGFEHVPAVPATRANAEDLGL